MGLQIEDMATINYYLQPGSLIDERCMLSPRSDLVE